MTVRRWLFPWILALCLSCTTTVNEPPADGGPGEDADHDARSDGDLVDIDADDGDADDGSADTNVDASVLDADGETDADHFVLDADGEIDGGDLDCHETVDATPFVLDDSYCVLWSAPLTDLSSVIAMSGPTTLLGLDFPDRALAEVEVDPVTCTELSRRVALRFTPTLASDRYFPSQYVAIGPDGSVAVGYNLSTSSSAFDGEMFIYSEGLEPPVAIPARGNYDAAWLEPSQLLVNGLGFGSVNDGQGLYGATIAPGGPSGVRRLIDNLGSLSGPVETGDVVLAGGHGTWGGFTGSRIYAFTLAELSLAIIGVDVLDAEASGDVVFQRPTTGMGTGQSATIVGSTMYIVVADDRGLSEGINRVPLTIDHTDDVVTPGDETPVLSTPDGGRDFVLDLSSHGSLLGVHTLLEDGTTRYMVLRERE